MPPGASTSTVAVIPIVSLTAWQSRSAAASRRSAMSASGRASTRIVMVSIRPSRESTTW